MNEKNSLIIIFTMSNGKKKTMTIANARNDLSEMDIRTMVEKVINSKFFIFDDGVVLKGLLKAYTETVTDTELLKQ